MRRAYVERLERTYLGTQRRVNFTGRHRLEDRSRGSDRLVVLLAGYKSHLWDLTLPRLARFLPTDADICVASPGMWSDDLSVLAERRGWSYLSTAGNYPSLAENLAIRGHPAAEWILKIDEDIFIGEGFFERLVATYQRVEAEGAWWPGFVAPLLNVNGYSYVPFLEAVGAADAYRERFGPLVHAAGPIPATDDGVAARWLWELTVPFDDVAARFAAEPPAYSLVPHKFSIGAVLLRREFWEQFRGFKVRPFVGGIGVDEAHLCGVCTTFSRVMVVAHDVLGGHFSFAPQDTAMRTALSELRTGLELRPAAEAT